MVSTGGWLGDLVGDLSSSDSEDDAAGKAATELLEYACFDTAVKAQRGVPVVNGRGMPIKPAWSPEPKPKFGNSAGIALQLAALDSTQTKQRYDE